MAILIGSILGEIWQGHMQTIKIRLDQSAHNVQTVLGLLFAVVVMNILLRAFTVCHCSDEHIVQGLYCLPL